LPGGRYQIGSREDTLRRFVSRRAVPVVVLMASTIGLLASPVSAARPLTLPKPIQVTMECVKDADGDISVEFLTMDGASIGSPLVIDCGNEENSGLQTHTINVKLPQQPALYSWAGAGGFGDIFGVDCSSDGVVGSATVCVQPPSTIVFTVTVK
jgi:hypothetical protein